MMDKLDPKDAALIAFIETIGNTGGVVELPPEESITNTGGTGGFGCVADREWSDLASAYLLACKATGTEPIITRRARPCIKRIEVYVARSVDDEISDEANDIETAEMARLFDELPDDVQVNVNDQHGEFLYSPHGED